MAHSVSVKQQGKAANELLNYREGSSIICLHWGRHIHSVKLVQKYTPKIM